MAIILITGVPGSGKSLLATYLLVTDKRFKDRKLFHNIDGLRIGTYMTGEQLKENWTNSDKIPDGSLIAWDEIQREMPPAPSGKEIPEHIQLLDVHRKRGIDFLALTQSPNSFHSFAKDRVTEHRHLLRPFGLPYCQQFIAQGETFDPKKRNSSVITKERFRFPRWVFHLYKSAEMHTDVSSKPMKMFYIIGGCLAFLAYVGFSFFGSKEPLPADHKGASVALSSKPGTAQANLTPVSFGKLVSPPLVDRPGYGRFWTTDRQPIVQAEPASAPVYATVYKVKSVPVIAGCMSIKTEREIHCTCTDQQGNTMPSVGDYECQRWMRDGTFDPTSVRDYRAEAEAWQKTRNLQGRTDLAGGSDSSMPASPGAPTTPAAPVAGVSDQTTG